VLLEVEARRFVDRRDAGWELAGRLSEFASEQPVVLGLVRGGVPVAYEIAQALHAPLDVLVVRKIGAPSNPEYGIGATVEGGTWVLNQDAIRRLLISSEECQAPGTRLAGSASVAFRAFGRRNPR
jgi:putative phosphoribosyl transferase